MAQSSEITDHIVQTVADYEDSSPDELPPLADKVDAETYHKLAAPDGLAPDDYDEVVTFLEARGFERQADLEVPQKRPYIILKSNSSSAPKDFPTRSA